MPADLLNSREDAVLLWAVFIVGFAMYKDPLGIGGALIGVFRALLQPKLLLLFGSALLYAAAAVSAARELGLWHTAALKATVYWFVGTAVVLVGAAVTSGSRSKPDLLRSVLRKVVAVTILVELVVNVYVLPIAVELVSVLVVLLFIGMQLVVQHDPSADPRVRKFIDGVLVSVGLFYLAYFVIRALGDLDGFLTRERAEDFLVPLALTVVLIPFLQAVAWLSRREQENLRKRWRSAPNALA